MKLCHRLRLLLLLLSAALLPAATRGYVRVGGARAGVKMKAEVAVAGAPQERDKAAAPSNPLPPDLFPYGAMQQEQQPQQQSYEPVPALLEVPQPEKGQGWASPQSKQQQQSPPPYQEPPLPPAYQQQPPPPQSSYQQSQPQAQQPQAQPPPPPPPYQQPPPAYQPQPQAPKDKHQAWPTTPSAYQPQPLPPPPPPAFVPAPASPPPPPGPPAQPLPANVTATGGQDPSLSPELLEAQMVVAALELKQELYLKDAERGGFYFPSDEEEAAAAGGPASVPLPVAVAGTGVKALDLDADGVVSVMRAGGGGNSADLALKSVRAAATSIARQGIAAAERKAGVGAGAIASPAVLNAPHPRLGVARAVFVGFKRIGAMNVDFNLPISPFDAFGSSCAVLQPAGDLDHDATSVEVAVGAPGDHTYMKKAGAVYIIFLANYGTMVRNYHKIIPGEGALSGQCFANAGFGTSVASMGDLNGDGYADIAVGAPYQDKTGVVYILFLGYGGVVASYVKISAYFGNPYYGNPTYKSPLVVGDEFGCSVANIGDLNRDGIVDLAVGACGDMDAKGIHDGGKSCFAAGAVYILFMNVDGTVKYHRKISAKYGNLFLGPEPGDRFGASITLIGDMNRDGHPEIAVGAPLADASGHEVGAVYILELLPSGDVKRFEIISTAYAPNTQGPRQQRLYLSAPLASHDYWGSSVAAFDVDRDGVCDLIVGSRGYNQRAQDEGAALVCYLDGGMALTGWEHAASQSGLLVPVQPGEQFGASVAVLDDPSRSPSFSLLFVGAPGECGDATGGSLYVLRVQPVVG